MDRIYRKNEERSQENRERHTAGTRTRTGSANSPQRGLLGILIAKRSRNEKGTGFEPVAFSFSAFLSARRGVRMGARAVPSAKTPNAPCFRARLIVLGVRGVAGVSPAGAAGCVEGQVRIGTMLCPEVGEAVPGWSAVARLR